MWLIIGVLYIGLGEGHLQVFESIVYKDPRDCFKDAMEIMVKKEDLKMGCIPVFVPDEDNQT
jgi:hypothetical protein